MLLAYLTILAIAFSGVLAGVKLASHTKEELTHGRKYFILLQKALILTILSVTAANQDIPWQVRAAQLPVALYLIAAPHNRLTYSFLGIALFLNSTNTQSELITATLMFLYGLPTGSLAFHQSRNTTEAMKSAAQSSAGLLYAALLWAISSL